MHFQRESSVYIDKSLRRCVGWALKQKQNVERKCRTVLTKQLEMAYDV